MGPAPLGQEQVDKCPGRAPVPALALPFPIAAMLFDLDDTLYDRDAAFQRWATALIETHGDDLTPDKQAAALARMIALDEHGYGPKPDVFSVLAAMHPACPPSPDEISVCFFEQFHRYVRPEAAATRLISALDRLGMPFGIVTNGRAAQLRRIEALGLDGRAACVLVSDLHGCPKPAASIFLAAAAALATPPSAILFVGDRAETDIIGAHRAGMHTAWLHRGRAWPPDLPWSSADVVLESLEDLLA
jgi:putative hydrolase of the HAD superfamily